MQMKGKSNKKLVFKTKTKKCNYLQNGIKC